MVIRALNELHYVKGVLVIEVNSSTSQVLADYPLLLTNWPGFAIYPLQDNSHHLHLAFTESSELQCLLGDTLVHLLALHTTMTAWGLKTENHSLAMRVLLFV